MLYCFFHKHSSRAAFAVRPGCYHPTNRRLGIGNTWRYKPYISRRYISIPTAKMVAMLVFIIHIKKYAILFYYKDFTA